MANKRLNAVITIGGAVAGSLRSAFGTVTAETNRVGAALQQLTNRQRELNAQIVSMGRNGVSGSQLRAQYAQQELATIGKQITLLKQRQALENARTANTAKRGEIAGKIGSTMAGAALITAPIGAAVKEAANFDYDLQLIGNTADMTAEQINALKRSILDTSKATGQSATNIQKGMGFLIAAGMKPGQATQFLGSIGKTATASAAEVEDLSKMVFTLNDSLKIRPEGMQAAIDTLAQAGKEGNVELKDMAKQLPTLGAGFVSLKMEGREAAATMGAALQIARKGAADADEAANNMKNYIAKVMSPETLKKAKKHFNLDLYAIIQDAQKNGKNPFEESMTAIMTATKGDQKAIGDLFQDMQVQNFLRPMIQNWEEYKRIKDVALGADGVTERDFIKMMETTKQKAMELGNAVGRLGIAFGSIFSGKAGEKSAGMAERVNSITDFITANKELVGITVKVVGGLFAARIAVLGVQYAFASAQGVWLAGRAIWMAAPAVFTAVGTALRFVGTSLLWVGRALLLNPIGLTITAIAGAAFLIYKYWEPIKEFFGTLWEGVKSTFASVYDWIVGKVAAIFGIIGKVKAAAAGIFGGGGGGEESGYDAMGNATGAAPLPAVPTAATRGGTTVNDNSQTTINVNQQPGQDAKALAEEITRLQRKSAGVARRSSLVDGVGAQ